MKQRMERSCYDIPNLCGNFRKPSWLQRNRGLKLIDRSSAESTETLTFVSLKLCFLGFVNRHNELFFSYLWSFVHEFTSSSIKLIAS